MSATATDTVTRIKLPSQWAAVLLYDEQTPIEFTQKVLVEIFDLPSYEALSVIRTAASERRAIVFTSTREIVDQKISDAGRVAQKYSFPLKFIKQEV